MEVDVDTRCTILNYLKLIKKRASGKTAPGGGRVGTEAPVLEPVHPKTGELATTAKWMREFVASHPQYKEDSVITDKINYDLMVKCDRIAKGEEQCPELIGYPVNKSK